MALVARHHNEKMVWIELEEMAQRVRDNDRVAIVELDTTRILVRAAVEDGCPGDER